MATVPIQNTPSVELETGQAPLFSATNIQPVRDPGTAQDIDRLSQTQRQFAQIAAALQDEQDELEAGEAVGNYQNEAQQKVNEYLSLKGSATVATVGTDIQTGKSIKQLDQLNIDLDDFAEKHRSTLSSKNARDIFNSKFSAYKRIHINQATKHSLSEKSKAILAETTAKIELHKEGAKNNYATWDQPDGDYEKFVESGLLLIKRKAELNSQNTDLANGPLSSVYLKEVMNFKTEIAKEVVKNLVKDKQFQLAKRYENSFNPDKQLLTGNTKYIDKKHGEHCVKETVDGVLSNSNNQNNGEYLSQVDKMSCLKSNNFVDDGQGGSVQNGLHSNEVNIAGTTKLDNINALEQIKNQSIFYNLDSNKTLIEPHQPTHLFAVQHIGVQKADSLYLKAKREYELPEFKSSLTGKALSRAKKKFEEEFLQNPDNENLINAAIIDKYNKLIIEEAKSKYSRFYSKTETIFPNAPQRNDFPNTRSGGEAFNKARKEFLNNPENAVQINPGVADDQLEAMTGTKTAIGRYQAEVFKEEKLQKQEKFINQIANDLGVIQKGINYDIASTDNRDPITGLRPINELKEELKDTILDKEELKDATKDLETKYNEIKNERTAIYNESLDNAKEIVYTGNGVDDLENNNIDIEMYTPKDQEILKKGQPKESNVDTVVELINNPALVRDNLNSYSHMLDRSLYNNLRNYARELQSENKYVEATGNVNMLKATLDRHGMGNIYKQKRKKPQYIRIYDAWLKEINAQQINNKNTKLTMGDKQKALDQILLRDLVSVDNLFRDEKDAIYNLVDFDRLQDVYVDVPYNDEVVRVFTSQIDPDVVKEIQKTLRKYGQPVTQKNIAKDWLRVGKPKNTDELFSPLRSN